MPRPRDPDKKQFQSVGLRPADWDYLKTWAPPSKDTNPSVALEEMIDTLRKLRPVGPVAFGRPVRRAKHLIPTWVKSYAADHGMSRMEAIGLLLKGVTRPD